MSFYSVTKLSLASALQQRLIPVTARQQRYTPHAVVIKA